MIERDEQAISLGKLLQVCEVYHIPIEEVICLKYQEGSADELHSSIVDLLEQCDLRQLSYSEVHSGYRYGYIVPSVTR